MGKHTGSDLYQMQSLPLSAKIQMTERRIREWVEYYGTDGSVVSFSGEKDSTLLLYIARKMFPDIPAVFLDTGWSTLRKCGYPFIGKEVAGCVYGARRYMEKLLKREQESVLECSNSKIPNHSYMADLEGIDRRQDKENSLYQRLIRGRYQVRI